MKKNSELTYKEMYQQPASFQAVNDTLEDIFKTLDKVFFGEKKYDLLNKEYSLKTYQAYHEEDLKDYQQIFLDKGIDCFF